MTVAISAQAASPVVLSGVTPTLPSLSVGGLNYTDLSDSGSAQSSSASRDRLPASQGLTAGRDVKFLSVFVVSGGIQMPSAPVANLSVATSDTK